MRTLVAGLVSVGLLAVLATPSEAYSKKRKRHHAYGYNSPSAIAERQRHARTFDETQYYERELNKIPMGTRAWWDQLNRERGGGPRN